MITTTTAKHRILYTLSRIFLLSINAKSRVYGLQKGGKARRNIYKENQQPTIVVRLLLFLFLRMIISILR